VERGTALPKGSKNTFRTEFLCKKFQVSKYDKNTDEFAETEAHLIPSEYLTFLFTILINFKFLTT
jgi:hypothetical protein